MLKSWYIFQNQEINTGTLLLTKPHPKISHCFTSKVGYNPEYHTAFK